MDTEVASHVLTRCPIDALVAYKSCSKQCRLDVLAALASAGHLACLLHSVPNHPTQGAFECYGWHKSLQRHNGRWVYKYPTIGGCMATLDEARSARDCVSASVLLSGLEQKVRSRGLVRKNHYDDELLDLIGLTLGTSGSAKVVLSVVGVYADSASWQEFHGSRKIITLSLVDTAAADQGRGSEFMMQFSQAFDQEIQPDQMCFANIVRADVIDKAMTHAAWPSNLSPSSFVASLVFTGLRAHATYESDRGGGRALSTSTMPAHEAQGWRDVYDASLAAAIVDFATAPGPCVKCDNRTVSPASSHAFPGLEAAMDEGCVKKAHLTKTPRSIHGGDAFGSLSTYLGVQLNFSVDSNAHQVKIFDTLSSFLLGDDYEGFANDDELFSNAFGGDMPSADDDDDVVSDNASDDGMRGLGSHTRAALQAAREERESSIGRGPKPDPLYDEEDELEDDQDQRGSSDEENDEVVSINNSSDGEEEEAEEIRHGFGYGGGPYSRNDRLQLGEDWEGGGDEDGFATEDEDVEMEAWIEKDEDDVEEEESGAWRGEDNFVGALTSRLDASFVNTGRRKRHKRATPSPPADAPEEFDTTWHQTMGY